MSEEQKKLHENHRENVAGRANVADTPELLAYYDELKQFEAGALWTVANKIEPWEPVSESVPVVWRYQDYVSMFYVQSNWLHRKKQGVV